MTSERAGTDRRRVADGPEPILDVRGLGVDFRVDGEWVMGVQLAPNQVTPDWPSGPQQQQVHLDLHVDDLEAAERLAVELGGHLLQPAKKPADNPDGDEMFAVYASPAGHPLCFGVH